MPLYIVIETKRKGTQRIMGMGVGQLRLLQLTARKHDIEYMTTLLTNDKLALTRQGSKVSKEYQNALSAKTLKLSGNGGIDYTDISYSNLMSPNAANNYNPYLITDLNDKVVVDDKYKQYAALISSDGSANMENWKTNRVNILSSLTGISAEKIASADQDAVDYQVAQNNFEYIKSQMPRSDSFMKTGTSALLGKMTSEIDNTSWQNAYNGNKTHDLGDSNSAAGNLETIINQLKNGLGKYFLDSEKTNFEKACDVALKEMTQNIKNGVDIGDNNGQTLYGDASGYTLNLKALVDQILCMNSTELDSQGNEAVVWHDTDSSAYATWQEEYAEWETQYNEAKAALEGTSTLTSDEKSQIEFYEKIFSTIAEKGWTYNQSVSDSDTLNQFLQNNMYTITTVDREETFNERSQTYEYSNKYDTNIARNMTTVYEVSDSDDLAQITAEYEEKKAKINEKETRIDLRLENLKVELNAAMQMIQSIQSVINKNIETTMNFPGA